MIARFFRGLGALIVLVAVIAGIPAFLILVVGNPLPTAAQWQQIAAFQPDYGNVILLTKILPCVAWIAWGFFALPWLYELVSRAAGHAPQRAVWLFRGQQRMAAVLIAAVFLMFAGTVSLAAVGPAHAAPETAQDAHAAVAQFLQTPPAPAAPVQTQTPASQQAAAPQAEQHADLDYQVKPGDNLWNLAEQYLGDGADYHQIADASGHIVQAGGQHLGDPDLILPGWHLDIPGAGPAIEQAPAAPAAPAAPEAPAPEPAPSTAAAAADAANASAAGADAAQPAAAHDAVSDAAVDATGAGDFSSPLITAGGIAGLMASGLLAALGARRLQQRRRRNPGERIAMPADAAEALELELRMVENPVGRDEIDHALRCLQAWAEDTGSRLPELLAVRVQGDEIALYLTEPAELPNPFERAAADGSAWIMRGGSIAAPQRAVVSPYPALTTVGIDPRGGQVLLDLEQLGALSVIGDAAVATGILTALAVELASNPWSDGVRVTVVGLPLSLARALDPYRVQHVDDLPALVRNLRADIVDRRAALDSYGVSDVHDARAHASVDEGWAPHIVLLAQEPTEQLRDDLAELVALLPRVGIATVTSGADDLARSTVVVRSRAAAEFRAAGDAVPPLPFRPQVLEGAELQLVEELFATSLEEARALEFDEAADTFEVDRSSSATAGAPDEDPDDTFEHDRSAAKPAPQDAAAGASAPAEPVFDAEGNRLIDSLPVWTDAADARAVARSSDGEPIVVPDWPAPFVRLLGPIEALSIADADALPARGVELMAFLLLEASPVSRARIMQALWPDKDDPRGDNARVLVRQLRAVLGNDPDGHLLLPEGRSDAGFALHQAIRADWDEFVQLVGRQPARARTEDLAAALRLVRGEPFTGAGRRRGWWGWRARFEEEMRAAVLDAADVLAARAIEAGDLGEAREAARVAQVVDPLNEAGWRLALQVAIEAGDAAEFDRVVDELYARLGADDPNYRLDARTQELVDTAQARFDGAR